MSEIRQNKKKLKLLYISEDLFPPYRVDVSVLFSREIVSRGHKIDWILQSEDTCSRSYEKVWHGGIAYVGKTDNGTTRMARLRKHVFGIINQLKLFNLIKKNNYDFVQVKNKFIASAFAIIACKIYKTKLIFWLSFPFPEESLHKVKEGVARYPVLYWIRGHTHKFLLYKLIMPTVDYVFVQSEQMKKDVMKEGVPENKLTPIPMGISLESFDEFDITNSIDVTQTNKLKNMIVYLGTIDQARKIDFLVRVFGLVLNEVHDSVFYIVGDGDDPKDRIILEKEAERLGISQSMTITGFLPWKEAMQYVKNADVCLSPYYPSFILNSTSPTKLVEYMAMGKAVVANDHPEQKLMLKESRGGICVPWDEAAFANAIVEILRDPELKKEMGARGREYVEKHREYNIIAENLEKYYFKIVSGFK